MNLTYLLFQSPSSSIYNALAVLIALPIIGYLASYKKERIGNWNHLYGNVQYDPERFYTQVEEILTEKEVPEFESRRTTYKEEGVLSHQRLYLEISRGDYVFHICAAPWGKDFFFSWWLNFRVNNFYLLLTRIPGIGTIIINANQKETYYELDSNTMFRTSVHQAVLAAIDMLTDGTGARGLTELERKPDLKSIFKVPVERP